jgi:hypothetical protein
MRAANLMETQIQKFRNGDASIIRTDADAELIEYLTRIAQQKNYTKSAPQLGEYIVALSNNGQTAEERRARAEEIKLFFVRKTPIWSGRYSFTEVNVPSNPT